MPSFQSVCFFALIILLLGCSKTEQPFTDKHALQIRGHLGDLELKTVVSHPDGGFVVGSNTRKDGKQKIWVMKYNQNMQLEWERFIEVVNDLRLEHLLINKEQGVFISGFSFGDDESSSNTSSIKTIGWTPYFHLLNKNGETLWEKYYKEGIVDEGNDALESINDVIQDRDGKYLICAQLERALWSAESVPIRTLNGIWPTLLTIKPDGDKLRFFQSFSFGRMESIMEHDTSFLIYNEFQPFNRIDSASRDLPQMATVFQLGRDYSNGLSVGVSDMKYVGRADAEWPWVGGAKPEQIGFAKQLIGDFYSHTYIFSDEAMVYRYSISGKKLEGEMIPTGSAGLVVASQTYDGNVVLIDGSGNVRETSQSFETINSFTTPWRAKKATKLRNGQYVLGVEDGRNLILLKYTQNGILIDGD